MATLGQTLREAREKKGVTASQAAAAIRMKVQLLAAMEADDLKRIAAPIYAKGFIRLYAEYLGLDPAPLIREYTDIHAPKERPALMPENEPKPVSKENPSEPKKPLIDWPKVLPVLLKRLKPVLAVVVVLAAAIFLVLGIGRCSRKTLEAKPEPTPDYAKPRTPMPVISEPPEPYLERTNATSRNP